MDDSSKQVIAAIASLITGAVLISTTIDVQNTLGIFGSWIRLTVIFFCLALSILMILVAVSNIDYQLWSRKTGYAALIAILALSSITYFDGGPEPKLNSDATLFTYHSAELITRGENPYSSSMIDFNSSYKKPDYITLRTDGTNVEQFSYPALSALSFIPQAILGSTNTAITTGFFLLATILYLVRQSPEYLAPLPPALFYINDLVSQDLLYNINSLWLLPYILAIKFWYQKNYSYSAIALGISFAMKQNGWLAAPFLAIWIYREAAGFDEVKSRFSTIIGYGGAAFFTPNLPFILWNPQAWLSGVLALVYSGASAPQESIGIGISAIKTSGLLYVPKTFFTVNFIAFFIASLILYLLYWDEIKWTAWLAPGVLLLFNYRSLSYYITFFIPVAYYVIVLKSGSNGKKEDLSILEDVIR